MILKIILRILKSMESGQGAFLTLNLLRTKLCSTVSEGFISWCVNLEIYICGLGISISRFIFFLLVSLNCFDLKPNRVEDQVEPHLKQRTCQQRIYAFSKGVAVMAEFFPCCTTRRLNIALVMGCKSTTRVF